MASRHIKLVAVLTLLKLIGSLLGMIWLGTQADDAFLRVVLGGINRPLPSRRGVCPRVQHGEVCKACRRASAPAGQCQPVYAWDWKAPPDRDANLTRLPGLRS
eukprot:3581732-Prymnesium_polylepis.1